MKLVGFILFCLIFNLSVHLSAQTSIRDTNWNEEPEYQTSENLTKSVGGFIEANWKQAGMGFNILNIILEQNFSFTPFPKNLKENRTMEYVILHNGEVVKSYNHLNEYKAGWIFDLQKNLYPYAAGGILVKTKMREIKEEGVRNYTIEDGKTTAGTGEIGLIYLIWGSVFLKGSYQINPPMPFFGFGLNLGQTFADMRND